MPQAQPSCSWRTKEKEKLSSLVGSFEGLSSFRPNLCVPVWLAFFSKVEVGKMLL